MAELTASDHPGAVAPDPAAVSPDSLAVTAGQSGRHSLDNGHGSTPDPAGGAGRCDQFDPGGMAAATGRPHVGLALAFSRLVMRSILGVGLLAGATLMDFDFCSAGTAL